MALPIRDGNQTLTTLSTIIVNSAHVPAHSVVSLGSQAITDIATAVSGVELGPNTISALENIAVTFGVGASVTIGNVVSVTGGLTDAELRASSVTIGGSVQVSNFPATQSVTFSSPTITGSVSVLNLPATQAVTFTQAPVTFGNIAGSVTAVISGTPSVTFTQASVTFTQASVTFGQAVVSASNIGDLLSSVATDNTLDATTKFVKIGGHQSGSNQTAHIVHVSAGGSMSVDASGSSVTFTQASVTFSSITGSVSVLNLPATQTTTFSAITGSVSVLNLPATQTVTFTQASVTFGTPVVTGSVSVLNFPSTQTISGTVTANNLSQDIYDAANDWRLTRSALHLSIGSGEWLEVGGSNGLENPLPVAGTVTANAIGYNYQEAAFTQIPIRFDGSDTNFVAIGPSVDPIPIPISGTVTVGSLPDGVSFGQQLAEGYDNYGGAPVQIVSSSITQSISGTVTANVPMVSNQPTGQGQAIPVILITDEGKSVFDVNQSLPVSGAFYQATQPVSIASLPASTVTVSSLPSVTISSLPAISGTVTIGAVSTSVTVSQIQGTSVTTSNFTSTTASQTLVSANSARRGLTVFNEGAGNLHICAGATATTLAYQVRLSAGDYWECPSWQTSLTHSAQFATSGTARVVEIL